MAPLRTRVLTLVIDGVAPGYERPGAVGISEIAVWGREAPADVPAESGRVTCGSTRMTGLRDAVIDHCAASARQTRPTAECSLWRAAFGPGAEGQGDRGGRGEVQGRSRTYEW